MAPRFSKRLVRCRLCLPRLCAIAPRTQHSKAYRQASAVEGCRQLCDRVHADGPGVFKALGEMQDLALRQASLLAGQAEAQPYRGLLPALQQPADKAWSLGCTSNCMFEFT